MLEVFSKKKTMIMKGNFLIEFVFKISIPSIKYVSGQNLIVSSELGPELSRLILEVSHFIATIFW